MSTQKQNYHGNRNFQTYEDQVGNHLKALVQVKV